MRRPRPLLDLPRADRRPGSRHAAAALAGRAEGAGAGRRARRTSGSPASSARRPAAIASRRCCRPSAGPVEAYRRQPQAHGGERYVAILFADIRGFTSISEGKLPYDVVFLLNRYFRATGQAMQAAGGRLDKFIGDGVMAIFGLDRDARGRLPPGARRGAPHGAAPSTISTRPCRATSTSRLRIGIGLHAGPAIVGEMGYDRAAPLTAIGDTVNTASRLETLTKDFKVELVVSQELLDRAGVDLARRAAARGRHPRPPGQAGRARRPARPRPHGLSS